jgi:hypothetical protein
MLSTTVPDREKLKLAILGLLADGAEHSSQEIREHLRLRFNVSQKENTDKLKNGKTLFHNEVDLALANLQGAPRGGPKGIEKVRKEVYRITEYGKSMLKQNPF